jgi:hypothetical protein
MNCSSTSVHTRKCSYETLSPDVLLSPPAADWNLFSLFSFFMTRWNKHFAAAADQASCNATLTNQSPVILYKVKLHFPWWLCILYFARLCKFPIHWILRTCLYKVIQLTMFGLREITSFFLLTLHSEGPEFRLNQTIEKHKQRHICHSFHNLPIHYPQSLSN